TSIAPQPLAPVAAPTPAPATPTETVTHRLKDWADAWMSKDMNRYLSFYGKEFGPIKYTSAKWITERRRLFDKPGPIQVELSDIKAVAKGTSVITTFTQVYQSPYYHDKMKKTLLWRQVNGQWVIVKETNR
ncbi:MAG: nuclear transport factor 2 family protein, partial [Burkholderiales bacterium]|nr:nuclear transport factor 2 family protein [Burkholderiales bacterium]